MSYETALQALSDPTRRAIFEQLRKAPSSVGSLAETLPVSRPAVSQHLKVLKGAGLVSERRDGVRRIYGVELGGLVELRRYLDQFWDESLAAFKHEALRTKASPTPAPKKAKGERRDR
jgi:DNA-binding transcriptional ArsR family regulator